MKKYINLFYLFFPLLIGIIVGLITSNSIEYNQLVKPPLSPPGILFLIVWTILYLLMGISYFILKNTNLNTEKESAIYYIQLFINAMWSIIFFVFKLRLFAVIWIILLLISVIYMIYLFYQKTKLSTYLNIPYLIWILFATYLTIGIYILN